MSEERIIDLEMRYAHIEDFLEKLNQVVIDQQKTIERLEKEILDLKRGEESDRLLKNERPPHY